MCCKILSELFILIPFYRNSGSVRIEAEQGLLHGLSIVDSDTGCSGWSYVAGFDHDNERLIFEFYAEAGMYGLLIGYASPAGEKGIEFQVNEM